MSFNDSGSVENSGRPPNILFILFDKCRTDAVGCYGEKAVHTPNLDALAARGVRFANCFTPQALCGPARASILTGSYPHAHGLRRNVYPIPTTSVHSNYKESIADPFRDPRFRLWDNFPYLLDNAGYATAHIGKWHLGPPNPGFFDYWKSFNSLLRHWIGEPHQSRYRPDVHTDQGIRFMERHAQEPFFLYQSYYAPHEPLDPPRQFLEHYQGDERAPYYGTVSNLDWNVGRLVETLRRLGILDNTLIVATSDHGRVWGDRPGTEEGLCVAYEGSARVPLIMAHPGSLPQGTVWQSGVSLVDLMPTFLQAAGIQPVMGVRSYTKRLNLQGESLLERVSSGQDRWDRPIVIQNIPQEPIDGSLYDERALRTERYKLILRRFDTGASCRPGELYDLLEDPGERTNLYAGSSHSQIRQELAVTLRDWGKSSEDQVAVELADWVLMGKD